MKINSGHKLLAATLLAGVAQLSSAADINNSPYIGAMGTYLFPDQDRHVENGYGGTGYIGIPVGSYFAPEFNVYGLRGDRKYVPGGSDNMFGGGLNLVIYPFTRSPAVAPFLSVGGGAENDRSILGSKTTGMAQASGGFLIALNSARSVALRPEGGP